MLLLQTFNWQQGRVGGGNMGVIWGEWPSSWIIIPPLFWDQQFRSDRECVGTLVGNSL